MKPTLLLLSILTALPAWAETHAIEMYSRKNRGPMIYEPDFLKIAPGDMVRFISMQSGHNAATIDGMIPEGAAPFKSQINADFTATLTVPGTYGVKCSPHFAMGMVRLIQVGESAETTLPDNLPRRAKTRFDAILATAAD